MKLVSYREDDFDRVIQFIARLNGDGAHHIGYFGLQPIDIRHTLEELEPPLTESFVLAVDGGELVGLLGAEMDADVNRAWLYGPLIEAADWQPLADDLYTAVRAVIPPSIGAHELFFDARNHHCQQFAERYGFKSRGDWVIYVLPRGGTLPAGSANAWDARFFDQFAALHNTVFPNTYYTAQQVIDRQNEHVKLLLATQGDDLQGYVFGKVDPEAGEGYIDFIGVDARWRGQQIGKRLLAALIGWMFGFPSVQHVDLTVSAENAAALGLYDSFGFARERTMRAYRT